MKEKDVSLFKFKVLFFLINCLKDLYKQKKGIKVYFFVVFSCKELNLIVTCKFDIRRFIYSVKCGCIRMRGGYVEHFYISEGGVISYIFLVHSLINFLIK